MRPSIIWALPLILSGCAINDAIDNAMTSGIDYTTIPEQRLCYIVIEESPIYFEYSAASEELARRGLSCGDYKRSSSTKGNDRPSTTNSRLNKLEKEARDRSDCSDVGGNWQQGLCLPNWKR